MAATSGFHRDNTTPDVQPLVAALDWQATLAGVRRLREWTHEALAVRPGEVALDVGSGTGSETAVLAAAGCRATGIEPNPGLRAVAEQRHPAARFTDGVATALPVPDGSVDVLWCERVFQHLDDAESAAAEFGRVLAPGGRVAVLDSDWATMILHPGEPDVVAAILDGALVEAANPYAGRLLAGQLTAAGLVVVDTGSQALVQDHASVSWALLRMMGEKAVRLGRITSEQLDRLDGELRGAAGRGDLHLSVTMFAVVARRSV